MKNKMIPKNTVILFAQQIAALLAVGVTLLPAIKTFARHLPGHKTNEPFRRLTTYLETGFSFGEALTRAGGFPDDLIRLVQAGEPIGRVGLALEESARALEEKSGLVQQIVFSLLYPGLIVFGSLTLVIFWLMFLLPTFQQVFDQIGTGLPAATRMLLAFSRFLRSYGKYLAGLLILSSFVLLAYGRSEPGRRRLAFLAWRVGPVRKIIQQTVQARLAQVLSSLLRSGLPLLPSLEITRQAVAFIPARERLFWAVRDLKAGRPLTASLKRTGLFSPFFLLGLASGEDSGQLAEILERLGRRSQEQAQKTLKLFTSLLEPSATIITGLLVGFVIISIFLPLVKLTSAIQ